MSYSSGRPLLYAHRGAKAEQPENTLASFARAVEIGADALELDVHLTADGHVVVTHDPSGLRMAGVDARFCDATLADIATWDAGYGFVDRDGGRPFRGKDHRFVTLDRVLAEFPDIPLNVDIKPAEPALTAAMLDLLRRTGDCERVTLASFHTSVMLAVRRAGYEGATAMSRTEAATLLAMPRRLWRALWQGRGGVATAAQVPTRVGPMRMDRPRFIARCHAVGMRVDYWTINAPDEARRLLALGADGIMTDDPAAIKPVFDELAG